jgi:hypothetical protein
LPSGWHGKDGAGRGDDGETGREITKKNVSWAVVGKRLRDGGIVLEANLEP